MTTQESVSLPLVVAMEDDRAMCALFQRSLGRDYRLKFVDDSAQLWRTIEADRPDLLLLDIVLPTENGIEIAKAMRATFAMPIVLISGLSSAEMIATGLNVGADDYVTKPFDPLVLRARLHNALRRAVPARVPARPLVLRFEGCYTDPPRRLIINEDGRETRLTEKEYQLLVALARQAGSVVDRDELSRLLSGSEWSPLNRVLDVHVSNLRRKLRAVTGSDSILASHRGSGYTLQTTARFDD